MPKFKFGLRTLLSLPICVGAFYLGWQAHLNSLRTQAEQHDDAAKQHISEIHRNIAAQDAFRKAEIQDSLDRIEHRHRMKAYESMISDPIGTRMMQEGRF